MRDDEKRGGGNTDERDPIQRLAQTHRRLEERLAELVRAAETLVLRPDDEEAQEIIEEVIGFFSRGGARHVEDEEKTLFPRIRHLDELAAVLEQLEAEHIEHQAVERALSAESDPKRRVDLAKRLDALYRAHITREEEELFPRVKRLVDPGALEEMGREMMERRPDRGKGKR
jgi:hemerythrin-like domain-containing protein